MEEEKKRYLDTTGLQELVKKTKEAVTSGTWTGYAITEGSDNEGSVSTFNIVRTPIKYDGDIQSNTVNGYGNVVTGTMCSVVGAFNCVEGQGNFSGAGLESIPDSEGYNHIENYGNGTIEIASFFSHFEGYMNTTIGTAETALMGGHVQGILNCVRVNNEDANNGRSIALDLSGVNNYLNIDKDATEVVLGMSISGINNLVNIKKNEIWSGVRIEGINAYCKPSFAYVFGVGPQATTRDEDFICGQVASGEGAKNALVIYHNANDEEDTKNGNIYMLGVGGYAGQSIDGALSVQEVLTGGSTAEVINGFCIDALATEDIDITVNRKTITLKAGVKTRLYNPIDIIVNDNNGKITNLDVHYGGTMPMMNRLFVNAPGVENFDVSMMDFRCTHGSFKWNFNYDNDDRFYICDAGILIKGNTLDVSGWDTRNMRNIVIVSPAVEVLDVSKWDTGNMIQAIFQGCSAVKVLDMSKWDTKSLMNVESMFNGCSSLKELDVSNFDVSRCTDMTSTFEGCSLTSLDLSKWDVSKVKCMYDMFRDCSSLISLDLSGWDLSSIESDWNSSSGLNCAFNGCSALKTLKLGEGFGKIPSYYGSLDLSPLTAWTDDSVQTLMKLYDRKANGLGTLSIKLSAQTYAVLGQEGIATLEDKGYNITK